jgi:hypothetical protein
VSKLDEKVHRVGGPAAKQGAPLVKARAFDKVNPKTGARPDRSFLRGYHGGPAEGKGKYVGLEYADEGDFISVIVIRDDVPLTYGNRKKDPNDEYNGINVLFFPDGKIDVDTYDVTSKRQWLKDKDKIIAAAKDALKDKDLPGQYDGLGGKEVKRGSSKLSFDVDSHVLRGDDSKSRHHSDEKHDKKKYEGKQTFKQFLLAEAKKIKEPGWYVVDHIDEPVDGPMQERGAKELADEMNEKHAAKHGKGDITPYSAEYYTDYEIRRMNEAVGKSDAKRLASQNAEAIMKAKAEIAKARRNGDAAALEKAKKKLAALTEAKVFVQEPYGSGFDKKPVRKGEILPSEDGDEFEFVGVSADGKKLVVKRDGKNVEVSPAKFGAKITA